MSQVAKPGASSTAPGAGARGDARERPAQDGEFETLLKDKGREAKATEAGTAGARGSGGEPAALAARAVAERGGDAAEWRGLPGDLALPPTQRFVADGLAATDGARAAEAVARIERIAEQILRAVEVRLGPGGAATARLELDLGQLGQLRVALERGAEGVLAIRFEGAGPEATRLLVDHGGELVAGLEARGLALSEVALVSREGPVVRLGPAPEAQAAEAARRPAAGPATAQPDRDERGPEDERRRRQPPALPEEED